MLFMPYVFFLQPLSHNGPGNFKVINGALINLIKNAPLAVLL